MVPLYTAEPRSAEMLALAQSDPKIQVWWATRLEIASALAKKVRERKLSPSDSLLATSKAISDCEVLYAEIGPSPEIRARAVALLASRKLRAADALQLAAFLEGGATGQFVCLDDDLRAAALAEGATVLP